MAKSDRRKQMEAVVLYPLDWLEERSRSEEHTSELQSH